MEGTLVKLPVELQPVQCNSISPGHCLAQLRHHFSLERRTIWMVDTEVRARRRRALSAEPQACSKTAAMQAKADAIEVDAPESSAE
jgi:hypothetical protein